MHNRVTSHRGSSPPCTRHPIHACAPVCCVVVVFSSPVSVLNFVPPFSFQPFLMFTSEFNERSRSNPLCDFRLGTVATSDHETPLTEQWSRRETIEARGTKWNFDVEMDSGIPGPTLEPRRDEGMPTATAPMEIPTVPPPAPPPEEHVPEIRVHSNSGGGDVASKM